MGASQSLMLMRIVKSIGKIVQIYSNCKIYSRISLNHKIKMNPSNNISPISMKNSLILIDELSGFSPNFEGVNDNFPLIDIEQMAGIKMQFCGNGAEGICLKPENWEDPECVVKLFYGTSIESNIATSIMNNTSGACESDVFWNEKGSNHFSSNRIWHIRALSHRPKPHHRGGKDAHSRLISEILATYRAHLLLPTYVDKPIAGILQSNRIVGYVQHHHEGNFVRIRDIAKNFQPEIKILQSSGILLDYSNEAFNVVIKNDGSVKFFDLELQV